MSRLTTPSFEAAWWVWQVDQGDLTRVTAATGAHIQTTVNNLDPKMLGSCALFEEKQVGPPAQLPSLACSTRGGSAVYF